MTKEQDTESQKNCWDLKVLDKQVKYKALKECSHLTNVMKSHL